MPTPLVPRKGSLARQPPPRPPAGRDACSQAMFTDLSSPPGMSPWPPALPGALDHGGAAPHLPLLRKHPTQCMFLRALQRCHRAAGAGQEADGRTRGSGPRLAVTRPGRDWPEHFCACAGCSCMSLPERTPKVRSSPCVATYSRVGNWQVTAVNRSRRRRPLGSADSAPAGSSE